MNALERKLSNLIFNFRKEHNDYPNYISCTIRWNDSKEYVRNTIIALYPYDCDNEENDDRIFYYMGNRNNIYALLAKIDFTPAEYNDFDEYCEEVDKYDTDDFTSEDYQYLHTGEEFCIVDIEGVFDSLN